MPAARLAGVSVSIVIPVFNRWAFTRQCLRSVFRHTVGPPYEVIVVDNGSTDGTPEHLRWLPGAPAPLRAHRNEANLGFARACNQGARLAAGRYVLFLNNDTLVRPGWLEAMVEVAEGDHRVGVVGIQQLFPYTRVVHHTGIVFAADGTPRHLYADSPASLPHVNKQRDYQAVNGACLLVPKDLFEECGGFDEGYRNGYEDVDLCLAVREKGRRVVCCTSAFIYHYGQVSETRTADDRENARRFASRWAPRVRADEEKYFREDVATLLPRARPRGGGSAGDGRLHVHLADGAAGEDAFSWANAQLAQALARRGARVSLPAGTLSDSLGEAALRTLRPLQLPRPPSGGIQVKWSHYWRRHLEIELDGDVNLELFAINYAFAEPGREPWDAWLQAARQNHHAKLPISRFCRDVLIQAGVPAEDSFVVSPGYSPEIDRVRTLGRRDPGLRLLTVTNSHDLERYGTAVLVHAFRDAFADREDVTLVVHDYGASSGHTSLRELASRGPRRPRVDLRTRFLTKDDLVRLYRSCDAFVSSHRGEGFGMKILDALACGLPAVVTSFGGSADFCTAETSRLVEYDLVPIGPCLDARSLDLANGPVWAEPRGDALRRELLWLSENRDAARALGERAAGRVRARFTWDAAANSLLEAAVAVRARRSRPTPVAAGLAPLPRSTSPSPHWLGTRVSVVIPTHDRKEKLRRCLEALRVQTILPAEFEVVVVDDGSTDGTEDAVAAFEAPFSLRCVRQSGQGPATARNRGIREARGEVLLILGDDIYADPALLEEHLEAHAESDDERSAVLGHVEWEPSLRPSAVMRYASGASALQSAYGSMTSLPAVDWRYFYTSNVSAKRRFLLEAAEAGIEFDACFRHAAFEDAEYAYRLSRRGLRIQYRPQARAFHDHWMDLDAFRAREERAGEMAVVFGRKHPGLDDLLETRWIGGLLREVRDVATRPDEVAMLEELDRATDAHLAELVRRLEAEVDDLAATAEGNARRAVEATLNGALHVLLDAARTRGKAREWYAGAADERLRRASVAYLVVRRKLRQLRSPRPEPEHLRVGLEQLDPGAAERLREATASLESAVVPSQEAAPGGAGTRVRHRLLVGLFALDRKVQRILSAPWAGPGRRAYAAVRRSVRRAVLARLG